MARTPEPVLKNTWPSCSAVGSKGTNTFLQALSTFHPPTIPVPKHIGHDMSADRLPPKTMSACSLSSSTSLAISVYPETPDEAAPICELLSISVVTVGSSGLCPVRSNGAPCI